MLNKKKLIYTRKKWWIITFAVVLLMMITTSVFAEGEEPPVADSEPVPVGEGGEELPPPEAEEPMVEAVTEEPAADMLAGEPAAEEPAVEETAEPPAVEVAAESPAPEEPTAEPVTEEPAAEAEPEQASLIEAVVESGTELVDAEGAALELASEESAELLASADPYYSVGLTTYNFYTGAGPAGCAADPTCFEFQGSNVIQDALNYMSTSGLPSDRKLYVEAGSYDGFNVNGFSDPTLALLNGVIGVDGSESTYLTSDVNITNTGAGFTLSGFTIHLGGSLYAADNSGTLTIEDVQVVDTNDGTAVQIFNQSGAVVMEGVNVSNNMYDGAIISTTIGSYPITISNSAFNGNGWNGTGNDVGLVAQANHTITLNGVAACDNKGDGIKINEYKTLKISDAFLHGNHSPSGGYGYALNAYTSNTGTAYLDHVYAYGNDRAVSINGGSLNAKYIEVNNTGEDNGLTFNSSIGSARVEFGDFHENYFNGIYMYIKGSIYLNSVRANNNNLGAGVYLENRYWDGLNYVGTGSIQITSPQNGGPLMANSFNNNGDMGIIAYSRGSVIIRNFDAVNNDSIGVYVDNTSGNGGVTVEKNLPNWINWIGDNGNDGLQISSKGTVKIKDTYAMWNDGEGFYVYSYGNIELSNVQAESNMGDGSYLDNNSAPFPKSVKITNGRFDHNNGYGLTVYSKGSITVYGLTASGNSWRERDVGDPTNPSDNKTYRDLLGADWIEDTYTFTATAGDAVDLQLESDYFNAYLELIDPDGLQEAFDNDSGTGDNAHIALNVAKSGTYTVIVKSFENSGSGEYYFSFNDAAHATVTRSYYIGARLDNDEGIASVTVNKPKNFDMMWGNIFDLNTSDGLQIKSLGSIKVDSASASQNLGDGLDLMNYTAKGSVTVTNSRKDGFESDFNDNDSNGLIITTLGNITLQNIRANFNKYDGAYIDNCQWDTDHCEGFGGVKILASSNRINEFVANGGYGVSIFSKGSIQLVNMVAESNTYEGAYLYNAYNDATGSIKISTSGKEGWNGFYGNGYYGLYAQSNGTISLSKINASGNTYDGAYLANYNSPFSPYIKIFEGFFYGNDHFGVQAYSKGNIIYNRGDASGNGDFGAYLDNTWGTGNISIKGTAKQPMFFGENGWSGSAGNGGVTAFSNGAIALGFANAEGNNGHGFLLDNDTAALPKPTTVNDIDAHNNLWDGLRVYSLGAIKVNGITAYGNGWYGARLDNDGFGATGNVSVGTTRYTKVNNLNDNQGGDGLNITSLGSVNVKNTNASANSGNGIWIDNSGGTGSVNVSTLRKENFWITDNGGYGLYIHSEGNVTIKNKYRLMVWGNNNDGIWISNLAAEPKYVVIENVMSMESTTGEGIYIETSGNVSGKSLIAQNNDADGMLVSSQYGYVTITGTNIFSDNGANGLIIDAINGNISISGVTAWSNAWSGISAMSDFGTITVKNTIAAHNKRSGLWFTSDGDFYLYNVKAFLNGQDDFSSMHDDGLFIAAGWDSLVTIKNSTFMTNWWGSGIEIYHPDALYWPVLINVYYLSNGGPNIYVHS